jgi:hypothetical protein
MGGGSAEANAGPISDTTNIIKNNVILMLMLLLLK